MPEDTILKAFAVLAVSVAGLGIILFFLRKYAAKIKNPANGPGLRVISKAPLQQKTNIYIVKAGRKTLLIGANDHNVSTLADLSPDTSADNNKVRMKNADALTKPAPPKCPEKNINDEGRRELSFRSFLRSSLKRYN